MKTIQIVRPRRLTTALFIALLAVGGSLEPANASLSQCPSGYVCLWSGTNYSGSFQKVNATGSYKAITLGTVNSVYNRRVDRTYVHQESDGSGFYACYNPGSRNSNVSGWAENAEAVWLSTATNC